MSQPRVTASDVPVRNRHTDVAHPPIVPPAAPLAAIPTTLPSVDWAAVGATAPSVVSLGPRSSSDPLPEADIVVLTWTSAEWFALDHVFINSNAEGDYAGDRTWKSGWAPYSRASEAYTADSKSGALWGSFQLVSIVDRSGRTWRVLLFKSNSHLAHPPWIDGLSAMLDCILTDTGADRIYTIGTAGAARPTQRLGDCVVTNAAMLDLERPQNVGDPANGGIYRCPSWFPDVSLVAEVQQRTLFPMDRVVTPDTLAGLFTALQAKHPDDPALADLTLDDLLNDALQPGSLGSPTIEALPDVPLLSTDFYFIARGDNATAYAFLEMDDAVIARQANRLGRRFACIRNISDPIVPDCTRSGVPIPEAIRGDWSGLIYSSFGLFSSHNGALATWATIAGQGSSTYNPPRGEDLSTPDDPLEVKLAFAVRGCGTCDFFWPEQKADQPYGPYTAFDLDSNVPYPAAPGPGAGPQAWLTGRTRPPAYPNGEVIDGCRKAPIMTIGINPNMTAFSPGTTGASWAYPSFSSDNDTDAWTKYAWYYRYRTVYQERVSLDFVRRFVLPEGRVLAPRGGRITSATRLTDSSAWSVSVRYDGDATDTVVPLPGQLGDFPYVLLLDAYPPRDVFAAGDLIAGRLAVPPGIQVEVMQQQQGYYMQFVPVLQQFQETLRASGRHEAELRIGEDVAQLDMVACASPHWNTGFLGGTTDSIETIVDNCVSVERLGGQTARPDTAGHSCTWSASRAGRCSMRPSGLMCSEMSPSPSDPSTTTTPCCAETTDPDHPAYVELDVIIDGERYTRRTRLVITPHFCYDDNFLPQLSIGAQTWTGYKQRASTMVAVLTPANGFTVVPPSRNYPNDPRSCTSLGSRCGEVRAGMLQTTFPAAWRSWSPVIVEPHRVMAGVLDEMYGDGELSLADQPDGTGLPLPQ